MNNLRAARTIASAFVALACASSFAAPPTDRERAQQWLKALSAQAPQLATTEARLEPARPVPDQPAARGISLVIHHDRILFDGQKLADQAALAAAAEAALDEWKRLPVRSARLPLLMVIDVEGSAPWAAVVRSLEQLADKGLVDVAFRFARPPLPRPFAKTPIDPDLASIAATSDAAGKAQRLAQLTQQVFSKCSRAQKAFSSLAAIGPADRTGVFLSMLDKMLGDPNCAVDPASVQGLVTGMVGDAGLQSLWVKLDKKAKLRPMAGFNATWHDVVSAGLLDKVFGKKQSAFFLLAPR